jgi:hypothetical protein
MTHRLLHAARATIEIGGAVCAAIAVPLAFVWLLDQSGSSETSGLLRTAALLVVVAAGAAIGRRWLDVVAARTAP